MTPAATHGDGATVLAEVLAARGVRTVFAILGDSNHALGHALSAAGVRVVVGRHEGGVAAMALGAARATGHPGVALVHQGPGLTNALTPLVEARKSGVPLVLLVGDTSEGDESSPFHVDEAALVTALGVGRRSLGDPERAAADLAGVFDEAERERRPVVVSVPKSVQQASIERAVPTPGPLPARPPVDPDQLAAAAELLGGARCPLVLAGHGAWLDGAGPLLDRLASRLGAMTCTTALAPGLFADAGRHLGVCGGFALPERRAVLARADVVLAVGTSLSRWTLLRGRLFEPEARWARVDVDASLETGPDDVLVTGGASAAVAGLLALLGDTDTAGWCDVPAPSPPVHDAAAGTVDPVRLTLELDRRLPRERTLVVDGGHFMGHPMSHLALPDPDAVVLTSARYQSIGLGLGAAIGAAVARPDRLTVLCSGDAGLAMAASELETAGRLRLPLLAVVYDDAQYGAEVHHFGPLGQATHLDSYPSMPFADVAAAWGWRSATVRTLADLAVLDPWLAAPTGPLLLGAKVDPGIVSHFFDAAHGR